MLALIVSPCYGDTETFLGKPFSGTMADWDKCQIVSTLTSNDTYHTECTSAPEKCTGEYIRQHGNDTGVSYCLGNKLAAAAEGKLTTVEKWAIGGGSVLVVVGFVLICRKGYNDNWGSRFRNWILGQGELDLEHRRPRGQVVVNEDEFYNPTEPGTQTPQRYDINPSTQFAATQKTGNIHPSYNTDMVRNAYDGVLVTEESAASVKIASPHFLEDGGAEYLEFNKGVDGGRMSISSSSSGDKRRRLLQVKDDHPPADRKNTSLVVFNEHVTVPNEEIHKRFAQTILEYTGSPPLDLKLPSAHRNRKMLANDTVGACGYVKISPPVTPGGNFTYAHDACKTTASENITSYVFPRTIMELDDNGTYNVHPSWLTLTKNDPRLGHPADAGKYNDVLSWVNPLEQQVVAYPYTSFGHLLPYAPVMDADCDQDYEAGNHLQIKAHLNKIAHPELWDVSVGGGGGIYSRETMTTLYEVMSRVRTVTTAAMNGDYLSYSGEFQKSTLRNPQRLCAGAKKAFEWKNNGVQGGTTDVLFKETRNYCGNSMARPAFGIPPKKLLMDTMVHMYAGLSNVKAAIFAEFTSAPRTPADWNWLGRLSLEILGGQIKALNFGWTPVTGQQQEPEYKKI